MFTKGSEKKTKRVSCFLDTPSTHTLNRFKPKKTIFRSLTSSTTSMSTVIMKPRLVIAMKA